jgi:hypothetical protein
VEKVKASGLHKTNGPDFVFISNLFIYTLLLIFSN